MYVLLGLAAVIVLAAGILTGMEIADWWLHGRKGQS